MSKRFLAICLSVVVAIVLLVVFLPSYAPTEEHGTIIVQATNCSAIYQGVVQYTLSGAGSPINGNPVPATHSNVTCGSWSCGNVVPPAGTFLQSITPSATQSVPGNGTITFTLNFEKNQDAGIDCIGWTWMGQPWQTSEMIVEECNWVDVHFLQWVLGCPGYNVTLNETSWLSINQTAGPPGVMIFVVDDPCALNKTTTPPGGPTPVKVSQTPSINGTPVQKGMNITLIPGVPTLLDVGTIWQLVKQVDYEKSINWLGISLAPFVPPGQHPCVLFELVLPIPAPYTFTVQASAQVALVGDVDANPANNNATCPPLTLTVLPP